ncbi:MAG TPA: M42 family metallopeptidase [Solirubrobacterales bacterium]|nr:M42 family metallopeptidase [Solirubrobacterales bacterium]
MSKTPQLLDELLRPGAPSGYEAPAAEVWRAAASFADELSSDGLGSSIARVGEKAPLLAVVGHIDEIGLVVTHIDEKGFLYFASIGGWDPQVLVGQRVAVTTRDGIVSGVVGRKPIHLLEPDQRKKVVELKAMHIDVGATDGDEAKEMVRVGDPVVIAAEPQPMAGERLVSKAMDNRLGSYVALESLRRCAAGPGPGGSFAAVAAVQEEIGLFGARTAAFEVRPDVAVAVDVTHATDAPGVDEKEVGTSPLGSGPVIGRGSTLSPKVSELLVETAEAEGIEYNLAASGRGTSTDADVLQISRAGIPTGLVSIPLRYMHSPVEMCDLGDVEATVELLAAFGARLSADDDFSR